MADMETPTLFELNPPAEEIVSDFNRIKIQTSIREMNDARISQQTQRQTQARRYAAIARLHRRRHEADEVDHEYWIRRRNNLRLVD
ncbi:MAG TPA: hypothetical protein QF409_01965 [Acidimicrobiales bacterium]|nr:hypothetical protein [Acidimicrobiales bacterium]